MSQHSRKRCWGRERQSVKSVLQCVYGGAALVEIEQVGGVGTVGSRTCALRRSACSGRSVGAASVLADFYAGGGFPRNAAYFGPYLGLFESRSQTGRCSLHLTLPSARPMEHRAPMARLLSSLSRVEAIIEAAPHVSRD